MIAYLDSSVLLRLALNQAGALKEFSSITQAVSSRLLRAECLRTLDRLFAREVVTEEDQVRASEFIYKALDYIEQIPVDPILESVAKPVGLKLGTLDAIHLHSALKWSESHQISLIFLTHDRDLALAAARFGLTVLGV